MENAERGRRRAKELEKIHGLKVIQDLPHSSGAWPFLTVLMDTREARDRALSRLWPSGLGVTRLFIHDLTGYPGLRKFVPAESMPNASSLADRCLTITNSDWLSGNEFSSVCEILADAVSNPAAGSKSSSH